jgi:hypothetical protein
VDSANDSKEGKNGTLPCNGLWKISYLIALWSDVDAQAVPPQWPPLAKTLVVEDGKYELTVVPVTSIALVTGRTLKVMTVDNRATVPY